MTRAPFLFGGQTIAPGSRSHVPLPVSRLPTGTELSLPVEVLHGARPGPTVWLSGAIHGDEIVGVEIIRQVVGDVDEATLGGTIISVPVVNVFGFLAESRYLPDRRDLNRSFPGSRTGSLAAQLARLFLDKVVEPCDVGFDFHAGSGGRTNLPQIRGDMTDPETHRLAIAFGAPLAIHSNTMRGTLREAVTNRGKQILLFEGGEPRRFSPMAVSVGVAGTRRALVALGMTDGTLDAAAAPPLLAWATRWVRAPSGGIFRLERRLGEMVKEGLQLGTISGPSGGAREMVRATASGMILGHAVSPIVHRGDALVHIARDDVGQHDAPDTEGGQE